MEDKKADNKIIENKVKIKELDSKIEIQKDKNKKLDELEEIVTSLNKNINICLELLSSSIKGNNNEKKLSAIEAENQINYKKSISNIEIQRKIIKNNIKKMNDEKENILNKEKNK